MPSPADRLREMIVEHGFAVQGVFAGDDSPEFAYTAGLSLAGLPELVIVGLPSGTAHSILSDVAARMSDGRIPDDFAAKPRIDGVRDVLEAFPVSLRLLPVVDALHDEWMVQTGEALGTKDFRAVQIVWPDKNGLFPEDPGCSAYVAGSQNAIHDWSAEPLDPLRPKT